MVFNKHTALCLFKFLPVSKFSSMIRVKLKATIFATEHSQVVGECNLELLFAGVKKKNEAEFDL